MAAVVGEGILAWSIFKLGLEFCSLPQPLVWTLLPQVKFQTPETISKMVENHQ